MSQTNFNRPDTQMERRQIREKFTQNNRLHLHRLLRKKLIRRLILVALLLCVILSLIVWLVQGSLLRQEMLDLGRKRARILVNRIHQKLESAQTPTFDSIRPDMASFLTPVPEHTPGRFVSVSLYNLERKLIQQMFAEEFKQRETLELLRDRSEQRFAQAEALWSTDLKAEDLLFIQLVGQIQDPRQQPLGYMEVIYEVYPATVTAVKKDVLRTIVIVLLTIIATAAVLYPVLMTLSKRLIGLSTDLMTSHFEVLSVLSSAVAQRDNDTSEHNFRVTIMATRLAETIGMEPTQIRDLFKGALMHDVGKIGIHDEILLKPGKLSEEEFQEMQTHVAKGYAIAKNSPWLTEGTDVIRYHHEKYDGTGYLEKRAGKDIPLAARVFSVVDVFDALTSRRPYKEPMPFEKVMQILEEGRENHFDPTILDAFVAIAPELYQEWILAEDPRFDEAIIRIAGKYFTGPDNLLSL